MTATALSLLTATTQHTTHNTHKSTFRTSLTTTCRWIQLPQGIGIQARQGKARQPTTNHQQQLTAPPNSQLPTAPRPSDNYAPVCVSLTFCVSLFFFSAQADRPSALGPPNVPKNKSSVTVVCQLVRVRRVCVLSRYPTPNTLGRG